MGEERKQRVLIVHNYYQVPGGEDTVVANEKRLLEENGHEVILYTRNNSEIRDMGILQKLLLPVWNIFNLKTYSDVRRIIKEQKVNIVHVHNTLSLVSPSVYYAARACRVPVVQTIHNFRLLCPGATFCRDGHICEDCIDKGLSHAVKYGCYRKSRLQTFACAVSLKFHRMVGIYGKIYYICLTEFNRKKLLLLNRPGRKGLIDSKKVFVKPNFTFETPSNISKKQPGEYYLFIGRIEEIKGLDILLGAFERMPEQRLVIAGTGPQLKEYKKRAGSNVTFMGYLDKQQLSECLSKAKAVIVPSQCYETFGMIIVEAYAAHKPVIAGDIGNISGIVDENSTGLKFEYDSEDALITAVKRFEKENWFLYEEKAYKKWKTEFSPEVNYHMLSHIYRTIEGKEIEAGICG